MELFVGFFRLCLEDDHITRFFVQPLRLSDVTNVTPYIRWEGNTNPIVSVCVCVYRDQQLATVRLLPFARKHSKKKVFKLFVTGDPDADTLSVGSSTHH